MKKILYFDCSSGISGDMTLGALIHLGVGVEELIKQLKKINISGYELIPKKGQMNGITGIDLDVKTDYKNEHEHRSYKNIRTMIEESSLNSKVKDMAIDIFTVIGRAEAAVHDIPIEKVVFHEVGAVDSIVDIVGTAIAIDILQVDKILCSPVHDGTGFIKCRHGIIPVPVPAVMEMLKGSEISIVTEDVNTEMVTPTGAGILQGLKAKCQRMPTINVIEVGYGFGKRKTGKFNALRLVLGRGA